MDIRLTLLLAKYLQFQLKLDGGGDSGGSNVACGGSGGGSGGSPQIND